MKILLIIVIISFSTYMGYSYNQKYEKRFIFYKKYNDLIILTKNKIAYSNEKIFDIIEKDNNDFFNTQIMDKLKSNKKISFDFNSAEENEDINLFVETLGKSDSISQIDFLNSKAVDIADRLKESKKEKEKYKNLYTRLGFLIGLILAISIL